MSLDRYYNLFDSAKRHEALLFRAGDALQSRELNELQSVLEHRLTSVADSVFKDGDVVSGCDAVVNADTGSVTLTAGRVYLRGMVREVPDGSLTVPVDTHLAIGLRYRQIVVTDLEDPSLRDPAVGTANYAEPGAARQTYALAWGWQSGQGGDGGIGDFHAIYTVTNGVLDSKTPPPQMDAVTMALARYDSDANGHYVVDGLTATFVVRDQAAQQNVFSLSRGRANISGFKVERVQDARLRYAIDPDLQTVSGEPHVFTDSGNGSMVVTINRPPLHQVLDVKVTKEKTVSVTHGAYTGAIDALPDATVVQVLAVTQGATTYSAGSDYVVAGDEISWAPSGAEPAPGSTYTVTYRYVTSATVTSVTDDGFRVSGVVNGTTLYVDYSWRMPRIDILVMDQKGEVSRVKGMPRLRAPSVPAAPAATLALAKITYDWRTGSPPAVRSIATRAVRMDQLEDMQAQLGELYDLVAIQNLRTDASIREAGVKKGVFVDPFMNNDMRDAGVIQTAAVVGGLLTLPIGLEAIHTGGTGFVTLDYTLTPILEQTQKTGFMRINPYMAFDPIPAKVVLQPAVDQWTQLVTVWDTATTVFVGSGSSSSSSTGIELLSRTSVAASFLRTIPVSFTVTGFDASEALAELRFDDIDITPSPAPVANSAGTISGSFTIPANVPAGTKLVEFLGSQGNYGAASFVGNGTITTEVRRQVTTITRFTPRVDPLAQTFTLPATRVVHAIDLWFTAKGTKDVVVQIRECDLGFPSSTVLSQGRLNAAHIVLGGSHTRIPIDPLVIHANREYALVLMSDDNQHAVSVAQLGRYDGSSNTWVTAQPYQVGVLLSSSNASTWTAHQDQDLTFRLLAAQYTGTVKDVTLGTYAFTNASDLIALAGVDRPSPDTEVTFLITDADGKVHHLSEQSPLNLTDRISGTVTVTARLTGGGEHSPVLYPDVKTVVGDLQVMGDYISRSFTAAQSFSISVMLECQLPGSSSVAVYAESGSTGNWVAVPFDIGALASDGFDERFFRVSGLTGVGGDHTTRVRIVLTGSPAHRPFVRNLRAVTL